MDKELITGYEELNRLNMKMHLFMILFMIGMLCNFVVVIGNNGRMPVYQYDVDSEEYFGFWNKEDIKYFYLTDMIYVSYLNAIVSFGDILMVFSGIYSVYLGFRIVSKTRKLKKLNG